MANSVGIADQEAEATQGGKTVQDQAHRQEDPLAGRLLDDSMQASDQCLEEGTQVEGVAALAPRVAPQDDDGGCIGQLAGQVQSAVAADLADGVGIRPRPKSQPVSRAEATICELDPSLWPPAS